MIHQWKRALLERASGVFKHGASKKPAIDEDQVKDLHAKIGELAVADFFGAKAEALGREVRRDMIEPNRPILSIGQQCKLLSIARSSFYYEPNGGTEQNLDLMRQIDEQFLETPFFGIRRLMRLMGWMPIYQKPNTSRLSKGHKTYPYLVRGLRVERPSQVWCCDITYMPKRRGFLYLAAIMDWHTRKVLP